MLSVRHKATDSNTLCKSNNKSKLSALLQFS